MASKSYAEKLKDPRWQKKRLKILERDHWMCNNCGNSESTLHVHHLSYNGEPWDALDDDLITLCDTCHELEHTDKPIAEKKLISIIRRLYMTAYAIDELSDALATLKDRPLVDIDISVISWIISNPLVMNEMNDAYFSYLRNKNKPCSNETETGDLPF